MTPRPKGELERSALEASAWVARHAEETRTPTEQAEFEQWLDAHPENLRAYERVSQAWTDIGELSDLRPLQTPRRADRRGIAQVFAAACLAAAIAVVVPSFVAQQAPDYQTRIAQVAPLRLQDGSLVTLGARSAIDADFTDASKRQVTLRSGQAFFEIAHDSQRPFYVVAGDVSVRVVGTKFDVRRGPEETIISVREGIVRVSSEGGPVHTLHAGDQEIIEHRREMFISRPVATQIATIDPQNVAAWRDGRLSYNDAPLSELVSDLNRYYEPGVEISPSANAVRVTASFRTSEIAGFLDDIGRAFPVTTTRGPDGHYRVDSKRPAA